MRYLYVSADNDVYDWFKTAIKSHLFTDVLVLQQQLYTDNDGKITLPQSEFNDCKGYYEAHLSGYNFNNGLFNFDGLEANHFLIPFSSLIERNWVYFDNEFKDGFFYLDIDTLPEDGVTENYLLRINSKELDDYIIDFESEHFPTYDMED